MHPSDFGKMVAAIIATMPSKPVSLRIKVAVSPWLLVLLASLALAGFGLL